MEDANFEDSSINDSCWTIYENNIQTLLIEIYNSLNHVSPPIMQEFFDLKVTPSSLRNKNLLKLPKTNTSRHGTQAVPLDETPLDAVKGVIELRGFHPSTSTSGARRSDAATSDKDKQICFMLMSRT